MQRTERGGVGLGLLLTLLAGCGGGGAGKLDADLGQTLGTWQVLDLETGTVTASAERPQPADHHDRTMVFRRLEGTQRFVAVTEVTQAQWLRLAGTRPWLATELDGLTAAPVEGGSLPAWDLDREAVDLALATWNAQQSTVALALPDMAQWDTMAQASQEAWRQPAAAAADTGAAVFRQASAALPPAGSDAPDLLGLHDVRGSLWELTSELENGQAVVRGGSWRDRPEQAAGTSRALVARNAAHPLVGARLVLILP